jgi:hypothetical protein
MTFSFTPPKTARYRSRIAALSIAPQSGVSAEMHVYA